MVKKTKATSSPGITDLRVLQGAVGEGCVMFACFFLCQKGGIIPKKWWGGGSVNKPEFKNKAIEKKQIFFFLDGMCHLPTRGTRLGHSNFPLAIKDTLPSSATGHEHLTTPIPSLTGNPI